jgi:broad specificity phosphatase PhoE
VEWPVQEFDYVAFSSKVSDRTEILQLCRAYWQRRDPFYRDEEEAESFASLMQRVALLFQRVQQYPDKTILVFSHSGFIRAVLWAGLTQQTEITPKAMEKYRSFIQSIRVPNGAIVTLQLDGPGMLFSSIMTNHLERLPELRG